MRIETIELALRPRSQWEGCDLGLRLLQANLRSVFSCHSAVTLPWFALCLATYTIAAWLPALLIWLSKPWLDQTSLFAISRALFGERTAPMDVWRSQRQVWWRQFLRTVTRQRLSASRSFSQPVLQLEGLTGAPLRARLAQLGSRQRGVARLMAQAFCLAEFAILASCFSLQLWLAPHQGAFTWTLLLSPLRTQEGLVTTVSYAIAVAGIEPFYVAAGFGMYINRRVELEAWDIEQEFRRAFAA